ncbi:MAG: adenylosuccinate lyase [Elusimicrobia bacterium RIFCSPLOWO2_12_FULL_59_9]|nr:MAG: adenylosuccinate lyase [Elusimicrobia bacterium RIFCSPLOWO2_12_FULL_59_9]
MIERYSLPEMRRIWSPESRIRKMIEAELAWLAVTARAKGFEIAAPVSAEALARRVTIRKVRRRETRTRHETVAFLEILQESVRDKNAARFLHYGLTSQDILDNALALQTLEALGLLISDWKAVAAEIRRLSRRHRGTWMAGRTHGVHAEPITFGLKMAGWHAEALRNIARLKRSAEEMGYGKFSGAVGLFGALGPADERRALGRLGLRPEPVATQVIPRDRHAECMAALALSAMALERFATEIRHLQRTEVLEVEEAFHLGQKGSSAMPHKRNPVLSENICGLARLAKAQSSAALQNGSLWHERDMSHSSVERVIFQDVFLLLDFMLARFREILSGLRVDAGRMRQNLHALRGLAFSERVLLALIDAGMDRKSAYGVVQKNAMRCWSGQAHFSEVLRRDPAVRRRLSGRDLARCFEAEAAGRRAEAIMRRGGVG